MKRYCFILVEIVLIITYLAAGCARKTDNNMQEKYGNENTYNKAEQSDDEIELISADQIMMEMAFVSTKEGCYTSERNYIDGGTQLYYIDYSSKKKMPLSINLSGVYEVDEDTSWVKNATSEAALFIYNTHLYMFILVEEENNTYIALYQMDLDGRNRKQVCQWDERYTLGNGIARQGNIIYLYVIEQTADGEVYHLSSVDLKSGLWEKLQSVNMEGRGGKAIVGGYDNKLLVLTNELETITLEEGQIPEDILMNEKFCLDCIDLNSLNQNTIKEWKYNELTFCIDDAVMYYTDYEKKSVIQKNCRTNQEQVFMADVPILEGGYITGQKYISDGRWLFFKEDQYYALDMDSKEICQLTVKSKGELADGYMKILGMNEDSYLVCTGDEKKFIDYNNEYGAGTMEIYKFKFGMIKKDDFWNSNSVFEEITDVE